MHRRNHASERLLGRASDAAVVAFAGAAAAAGALLLSAGSASAPEPARLSAYLGGSTGATAAAVFAPTQLPTTVLLWPATWTSGSVAAGTPCSPVQLVAGTTTTRTIQANGAYRRCV